MSKMHFCKSVILLLIISFIITVIIFMVRKLFVSNMDIIEYSKEVNSYFEGHLKGMARVKLKQDHLVYNSLGSSQTNYPIQRRHKRDLSRFQNLFVLLPKQNFEINEFRYKVRKKLTSSYITNSESEYELCKTESVHHQKRLCIVNFMKLIDFAKEINTNMKRMKTITDKHKISVGHLKLSNMAKQASNATAYFQNDNLFSTKSAMSLTVSDIESSTLPPTVTTVMYHVEIQQIATKQIQKSEKIKPAVGWILEGGVQFNQQSLTL